MGKIPCGGLVAAASINIGLGRVRILLLILAVSHAQGKCERRATSEK